MKKLGFGAMRLPLSDPENPASIDFEQVEKMVDTFLERGFTYFDTAYPYHKEQSEIAIRKALVSRNPRDSFILADKMPTVRVTCSDDYPRFFEEQLKKCGVDYFDYYLMHNMGKERYAKTAQFGGFDYMRKLKEQGVIRHMGFSFHDEAVLLDRILTENPDVDFVQLQINYLDWESSVVQSRLCYETACRHNKPVIVMEPVKGGTLANLPPSASDVFEKYTAKESCKDNTGIYGSSCSPASYAIRFAASLDNVFMVLSGMSNIEQLMDNTSYMADFKPLTDKEHELLRTICNEINSSIAIPCTNCRYCTENCPKDINTPAYFALYNTDNASRAKSSLYYKRAAYGHGKASECIGCRICEKNCPQHIEIAEWLKKVASAFEV